MKFEFEVESKGQISDGYHTFDELYNHRYRRIRTVISILTALLLAAKEWSAPTRWRIPATFISGTEAISF